MTLSNKMDVFQKELDDECGRVDKHDLIKQNILNVEYE